MVAAPRRTTAIELGKYSPSLEVAFRIANAFALGIEEVLSLRG